MKKFEDIPLEVEKVWKQWAIAKWNREMLDESRKSVLASEASNYDGSEAYRERMARCSKKYKEFLKWWQAAIQKELELKTKLTSLEMQFQYYQAMNANKRAQMNLK